MQKNFLPFLFLWLSCAAVLAQSPEIDSLRQVLAKTTEWQQRIEAYRNLGYAFHGISMDSSFRYAGLMLKVSDKHNSECGRAMAWQMMGEINLFKGQNEEALSFLQKSETANRACGDKKNLAIVLANLAYALEQLSRLGESGDKLVARIELAKEMGDSVDLAESYRNLAQVLTKQNRAQDGLEYLRKGVALWLRQGQNPHYFYSEMAVAYSTLHLRDSTFYYGEKALAAAEQSGVKRYIAAEHSSLGRHYFNFGQPEKARAHYLEALAYFEKISSNINLPTLYTNLAEVENRLGNYSQALDYAQKALGFLENGRSYILLASARHNLFLAYQGLGDYTSAIQQALLWKAATDSLNLIDNARKVAEVENRYRTREQEATISQQQLLLERQRNRQRLLLIGGLLLLAGAAGLVFLLRLKRLRAELALQKKAAEAQRLQEQDQMKSAFFANISHEFRTPLTLILGPLREMEAGQFKGNAAKYFGIMRRNAERLLQLINQLLDLSRLESGKLRLQPQPGDLTASLRVMAHAFESLAAQRQIHYGIELPAAPLPVYFDRDKIEIIVANLLSNAFKFTPEEGRVQLTVSPETAPKKPGSEEQVWVELRVADTGIGIPADQQAHIFDRFYQVENTGSDIQPGSGIGLALTQEIVTLHGGTIAVESPVAGETTGTAFTVRLPLRAASLSPDMTAEKTPAPLAFEPAVAGEKIPTAEVPERELASRQMPIVLVVEDNADVRAYIAEQLRGQCRVIEAADGQSGLQLARSEVPDLILSDLMMPTLDGMALTRLLKADEHTSHIPVILLTAKAGQPDRLQGLETGAEAYLTKPFDAAELRLVVTKTIAQRQVLREKFGREIRLGLSEVEAPSIDDLFLQKVLSCIEENLDDDLFGVEQLAAGVNMSRSNLFRKLDALLGKSPTVLIRELRLSRAKALLEKGAGNTTEVAFMVGFNTPAYFVKCFTDEFGVSPGEVRKGGGVAKK